MNSSFQSRLFFLCAFFCPYFLHAASLTVQLRDPGGDAVANAAVTIEATISVATTAAPGQSSIALESDGKGNFRAEASPGIYRLSIRAAKFTPVDREIDLPAGGLTLPVKLEIPALETTLEVDAKLSKLANNDAAYLALRRGVLSEAWEVKDLKIVRENATFLLSGKVSFGEPVLGKVIYAVFEGNGSMSLAPIKPDETRYLEDRIGKCPIVEDFHSAIIYFTDIFAEQVRKAGTRAESNAASANVLKDFRSHLHSRPQSPRSMTEHLMTSTESSNVEAKLLAELYNNGPNGKTPGHSSFRFYMRGLKHHDLRFILDTRGALPDLPSPEEVALVNIDPGGTQDGLWYMTHLYGEWKKGSASSEENKRIVRAARYNIETAVAKSGKLSAVTEVTLIAQETGPRVIFFDLLPNLRVTRVSAADQDLHYIQESRSVDGAFAVILAKPLTKGEEVAIKIEYVGNKVLEDEGGGNYSVSARTSWYPNVNTFLDRATYHLIFRVPKINTLVSVGKLKREWKEGDYACSEWESEAPLAIAGFNYGLFKKKALLDPDTQYEVETFATSELPGYMTHGGASKNASMTPSAMAQNALVDTQNSIRLFSHWFGPLPYGRIAITQQPQFNFGQSWPTLVYLPVSAFLDGTQRYLLLQERAFKFNNFIEEVTPHEVAHQWWGHAVGWASYRDQWLSEGFAEFSASLFVESFDKKGDKTNQFWERLRKQIVEKNNWGNTANDAGSITLGERLDSEMHPQAYRKMVYPKGAYVVHMLRQLMWSPKTGDDDFIAMMKDFVSVNRDKNASTEGFMALVQKHIKPDLNLENNGNVGWFFRQFVYGSDIPKYKIAYDVKPAEKGEYLATFQITQSGVPDDFVMAVPVYVELDGRMVRTGSTKMRGNMTTKPLLMKLPKKPGKIMVNARHDILTVD